VDAHQGWWLDQGRPDIIPDDSIHACAAIALMQFALLYAGFLNLSNCANVINSWVTPIAIMLRERTNGYTFLDPFDVLALLKVEFFLPSSVHPYSQMSLIVRHYYSDHLLQATLGILDSGVGHMGSGLDTAHVAEIFKNLTIRPRDDQSGVLLCFYEHIIVALRVRSCSSFDFMHSISPSPYHHVA